MNVQRIKTLGLSLALASLAFGMGCSKQNNSVQKQSPSVEIESTQNLKKISFLLTNDMHGHLEPTRLKDGSIVGGLAYLGTIIDSIRNQPEYQKNEAAFFLLDSGDQFQGTLLSNYNEGRAMFLAMNEVGYDAVVPGNHDYDFGPIGWLFDKVIAGKTGTNPREVIEGLASLAKFPLLSANTYLKNTIHFKDGSLPSALDSQCKLKTATPKHPLDFVKASRPAFLKPYSIIEKAGVRVALIGLDNHLTSTTTTVENVEDLCFRDELDTYLEVRAELEGKADIFVLMIHNGNSDNSFEASNLVSEINKAYPNGVHLAAAGHTHFIHNANIQGVRVMQDGSETKYFGRADLYFDPNTRSVSTSKTNSKAGIYIDHQNCKPENATFCQQYKIPVVAKPEVQKIIDTAQNEIAPLATARLAQATETIARDRISESALSNILTDALRKAAQTEISFMNTGGIRADLSAGPVLYSSVFEVLPFSNLAVIMKEVPWSVIKKVLTKSIQTCGRYGALMQSGLKIRFNRECKPTSDVDFQASLDHVETLSGKVLFDATTNTEISPTTKFSVATLDFLSVGGSGYDDFKDAQVSATLGIAREMVVSALQREQPVLTNQVDGRMINLTKKIVTP